MAIPQSSKTALSIAERIDRLSIPEPNSGCWLWLGAIDARGYGRILVGRKACKAHRISWREANGNIPDGLCVLHRCDNPPCVNPEHLFIGTLSDNMKDMHAKGRHIANNPKGEANHLSKLTEAQARYVLSSPKTGRALAKELGVSKSCISSLRTAVSWKHLTNSEEV